MVSLQGRIMPLVDLAGVLGMPPVERTAEETLTEGESVNIVLARVDDEFIALRVDRIHRIEEVIVKAMASDPEERYAGIDDFARALLPFARQDIRDLWATAL